MLFSRRAAAVAERAHHAATSPQNDRPEPSEAQRRAGNYQHGHLQVQGLRIAIENPAGSVRSGITAEGKIWRTVLQHHYGRIKGTEGADGDQVDVFLGSHPDSELVFVIDQVLGGRFDEHKVIVGATTEAEARGIYLANYQAGWKGLGAITPLTMPEFKEWLERHDTRTPIASNRLPAEQVFVRANVLQPGSRGGRYYVDQQGHIRYGIPPAGQAHFRGAQSVHQESVARPHQTGLFAGRTVTTPAELAGVFRDVVDVDRERFWLLHLTGAYQPLAIECVSQGSLTASLVHPRETFKNALHFGTRAVAFVHNHPSGDPHPSLDDRNITDRLKSVAADLGIEVRHHVVVAAHGFHDLDSQGPVPWTRVQATPDLREVPALEGRLRREPPTGRWADILDQRLQDGSDVARIGQLLLDPGDQIALLIATDQKHRSLGVFPLAHGDVDPAAVQRAVQLSVASGAAAVAVVASQDGPQWQNGIAVLHHTAEAAVVNAGIRYLDTVSVGAGGRSRSALSGESLVW